ncbi:MAG: peptidoglycan DD-metalloendopeptidase family protein [Alphaproteobacteria bacterium]|nr:peptidoglycan DD-metalloendopeptidase family protein [Alphaproteobacteria bacterium]
MSLAVLVASGGSARAEADLRGDLVQGSLIRGRTAPGSKVTIDGKLLSLSSKGDFAFGFAYDRTKPAKLRIKTPDGQTESKTLEIAKREYKIQRLNGLPSGMVEPPASVLRRIAHDNHLIGAARARDTDEDWFADDFAWPVKGPITGVYGSQRILNGVPKRPHFGVDIAAGEGKPIHAPLGSIVSMSEKDMYYSGGTVILDHGHGVSTCYLHMSRVDVKVGDRLAKGDPVGLIGHTGRATGPHLCWRLNWFQERLDAALVVPPMA